MLKPAVFFYVDSESAYGIHAWNCPVAAFRRKRHECCYVSVVTFVVSVVVTFVVSQLL